MLDTATVDDEKRVEVWTKALGLVAVFIYICGYLIIAVRNANFGFSVGDSFKPRVLTTGSTFVLLCILPSYLADKTILQQESNTEADFARKSLALLAYLFEILGLVYLNLVFIHPDPLPSPTHHLHVRDWVIIFVAVAVISAANYLHQAGGRHIEKHPNIVTFSCLACFIAMVWNQVSNLSNGAAALNLWLTVAGLFGCWLYRKAIVRRLAIGHLALISYCVLVGITYYADLVFPHIYQKWGGGQPIPIAISFADQNVNKVGGYSNARLFDEDDAGFFVQYGQDDLAVFVPRTDVSRICYLEGAQPRGLTGVLAPSIEAYSEPPPVLTGCSP